MSKPSPSQLFLELPKKTWIRLPEEIDRLHPDLTAAERSIMISTESTYLNRRLKWGEVAKQGSRNRVNYCI